MTTATVSPKPAKPVTGTCRWVRRIAGPHSGLLRINGTEYEVIELFCNHSGPGAIAVGYRLVKEDGTIYDVDTVGEPWRCDCPDFLRRREGIDPKGCKHVAAMRVLLRTAEALY